MPLPLTDRQNAVIFILSKIGTPAAQVAEIVGCTKGAVLKRWGKQRRELEAERGRPVDYVKVSRGKAERNPKRPRRARRVYE